MPIQRNNFYGILFMMLHAASLAVLYITTKKLTLSISSNQVVFLYKFTILILILPWVFKDGLEALRTPQLGLHIIRGFFSIAGSLCFMYAVQHLNVADATAIGYLEQVMWAIIGIIYFQEKFTKTKVFVGMASVFGAFIVMQPGIISLNENNVPMFLTGASAFKFNFYYIFVLLAVGFWSANCAFLKVLGHKGTKTKTQLFYVLLFSSIFAYPVAFFKWEGVAVLNGLLSLPIPASSISFEEVGLELRHLKYILLLAFCYFVHSVAFFKALKYADLSIVTPFEYSRLLFIGVLEYLAFKQVPQFNSYIGYALIVFSGILLIRAEARYKRRRLKEKEIAEMEEEFQNV